MFPAEFFLFSGLFMVRFVLILVFFVALVSYLLLCLKMNQIFITFKYFHENIIFGEF